MRKTEKSNHRLTVLVCALFCAILYGCQYLGDNPDKKSNQGSSAKLLADSPFSSCDSANCKSSFNDLATMLSFTKEASNGFGAVKLLKLIYRRSPVNPVPGRIYYINSNTYTLHHIFTKNELQWEIPPREFNRNYGIPGPDRVLKLATITWV